MVGFVMMVVMYEVVDVVIGLDAVLISVFCVEE